MARTVRNAKLDTRTARLNLLYKTHPYWITIRRTAHLGYRKGKNGGGVWVARIGIGDGKYKEKRMGLADDIQDANGLDILNFTQAQEQAREWFDQMAHELAGVHYGTYTVKDAVDDYLAWYKVHRKSYKQTTYVINAHILPTLGDKEVSKITTMQLRQWFEAILTVPPRKRTQKNKQQQFFDQQHDEEAFRKRKSTANRILNVLKAVLNRAYQDDKVKSDDAWRRVKPHRKVDAPRVLYLDLDELKRLVNATQTDFREIVCGALYTGCRYGELTRMQVQDFDADQSLIYIRPSKNEKSRWVTLTEEGQNFFEQQCLGKDSTDLVFTKSDGSEWKRAHQQRRLKDAITIAGLNLKYNFHTLRHTHASQLAMQGVSLQVIAKQLGHSDTRMVEKHYAHLAPNYVSETIRAKFPKLGINPTSNVTKLKQI